MQNTAKAASPPIMVNISSSQLDIGHPQCPQRPFGKLDPFYQADGGENGVVLNCSGSLRWPQRHNILGGLRTPDFPAA